MVQARRGALVLAALLAAAAVRPSRADDASLPAGVVRALRLEAPTILVTDSGLGGLSVLADLEAGFRAARPFRSVTLVFANALPDTALTYNDMPTKEGKVATFDRALDGMVAAYRPDLVLVACNTLSVLYPETRFAARGDVPVLGIVDAGADALAGRLRSEPGAVALLLGTPTTIASGSHARALTGRGVAPGRIVGQACPGLETEIQADPGGDLVRALVEAYAGQAREALAPLSPRRVVAGLCCSHYGYSRRAFEEILPAELRAAVDVIDPNAEMSRALLARVRPGAFQETVTRVEVVSRAELRPGEREAIAAAVGARSPKTAEALRAYRRRPDLFTLPK